MTTMMYKLVCHDTHAQTCVVHVHTPSPPSPPHTHAHTHTHALTYTCEHKVAAAVASPFPTESAVASTN